MYAYTTSQSIRTPIRYIYWKILKTFTSFSVLHYKIRIMVAKGLVHHCIYYSTYILINWLQVRIRLSEKFLSFYEEIINAQRFLFYIILSNYVRFILSCWDKHRDISQTWFHVCMNVHRFKKHVCERKILFGQPNMLNFVSVSITIMRLKESSVSVM